MGKKISRDFKGIWIPRKVWLNKRLRPNQKCLLAEIDSLDKGDGCQASNEYLAEFLGTTTGNIAIMISDLRKNGYIIDRKFDGRRRWISVNTDFCCNKKQPLVITKGRVLSELNKDIRLEKRLDKKIYKKRKKHPYKIGEVSDQDCEEIANKYSVLLSYVITKREDMILYCDSHGEMYSNYKSTLMSWIRKDIQNGKAPKMSQKIIDEQRITKTPEQLERNKKALAKERKKLILKGFNL